MKAVTVRTLGTPSGQYPTSHSSGHQLLRLSFAAQAMQLYRLLDLLVISQQSSVKNGSSCCGQLPGIALRIFVCPFKPRLSHLKIIPLVLRPHWVRANNQPECPKPLVWLIAFRFKLSKYQRNRWLSHSADFLICRHVGHLCDRRPCSTLVSPLLKQGLKF